VRIDCVFLGEFSLLELLLAMITRLWVTPPWYHGLIVLFLDSKLVDIFPASLSASKIWFWTLCYYYDGHRCCGSFISIIYVQVWKLVGSWNGIFGINKAGYVSWLCVCKRWLAIDAVLNSRFVQKPKLCPIAKRFFFLKFLMFQVLNYGSLYWGQPRLGYPKRLSLLKFQPM
jgi:hypothetical protein